MYDVSDFLVVKQDRANRFDLTPVWAPVEPPAKRVRNLSCFTAESRIKCKEGFCQAEQSGKASTWGGPSQCTYSVWPWTPCSPT